MDLKKDTTIRSQLSILHHIEYHLEPREKQPVILLVDKCLSITHSSYLFPSKILRV